MEMKIANNKKSGDYDERRYNIRYTYVRRLEKMATMINQGIDTRGPYYSCW